MRTTELRRLASRIHMVQHRLRGIANTAEELQLGMLARGLLAAAEDLGAQRLIVDAVADESRLRRLHR